MTDGIPLGFKPHPGDFLDVHQGWHRWTGPKHKRPASLVVRAAFGSVMLLALAPAAFLVRPSPTVDAVQALPHWTPGVPVPVLPAVPARQGLQDRPKARPEHKPNPFTFRVTPHTVRHVVSNPKPAGVTPSPQPTLRPPVRVEPPTGTPDTPGGVPVVPPAEQSGGKAGAPAPIVGNTCHVGSQLGRWVKTVKALVCCLPTPPNRPHNPPTTQLDPPNTPPTPTPTPPPTPTQPPTTHQDQISNDNVVTEEIPAPQGN